MEGSYLARFPEKIFIILTWGIASVRNGSEACRYGELKIQSLAIGVEYP